MRKKITDLIKIDYNNINIINESKFDSLTIFIQNIKDKLNQANNIKITQQKPITKVKQDNNEISYSLFNNLLNKINYKEEENDNYIIDDNSILSPIYKDSFTVKIDKNEFKFDTMLQYIYFNEFVY